MSTVLVTGASGHLGQRVLELLLERSARVIATTRDPSRLAAFAARGVDVRRADFDEPSTLTAAFRGADRALLISTDALDRPGRRAEQHRVAIRHLAEAGVKHVAYTSFVGPAGSVVAIAPDHASTEAALAASSLDWTVLRNSLYADFLAGTLGRAVASGQLVNAQADQPVSYVTREDCARAAVGALLDGFDGRRTLDITGPAGVTSTEVAAIVSELVGKRIDYVAIPLDALVRGMVGAGLPEPVARLYASFDDGVARGELATPSDAVRRLTGREPTSLRDFLATQVAALAA